MSIGAVAPPRALPSRWPLVGRGIVLERLAEAIGRGGHGVILHGAPGVGKTRLAEELLDAARLAGRVGDRCTAGAATAGLPLGALAPLLPPDALDRRSDPVALYGRVAAALAERATPYLVVVDDAHHLDATSVVLLGQLLDGGVIDLVVTLRSGEPVSPALADLLRRDRLDHVEVGPLNEESTDTLLHLTLGGPVEAATLATLWSVAQGNALFLRELVADAAASGRLMAQHGMWRLVGTLPTSRRLRDVVEARLGALEAGPLAAVELLAAVGTVSVAEAEAAVGRRALETLERTGLAVARVDGHRHRVELAHPLHGEVVRARLPSLTRTRLLAAHADAVAATGARRREDPLRVATARLDAGRAVDVALLRHAARLARHAHDFPQVARLAGAALDAEPDPEALLLSAEARAELAECADVEALLVAHDRLTEAAPPDVALLLVALRVRNLIYGCQRPEDAVAVNTAAKARFGADHPELVANDGTIALYAGRPREALAIARRAVPDSARTRALRALVEDNALVCLGRCETALELSRRAYEEQLAMGDAVAISHPGAHVIQQIGALTEAGQFEEARQWAELGYEVSRTEGPPAGRVWFGMHRGRIALRTGRPATARWWLAESAVHAGEWGYLGVHRLALSFLATACAWQGDAAAARAACADLERLPPFAYQEPEQELGPAWTLAAEGHPAAARDRLAAAAGAAAEAGWISSLVWVAHELARLGDPAAAREILDGVERDAEGALVPAYAAHARALAGRSATALEAATDTFAALGVVHVAAELAAAAADALQRDGRPREAAARRQRAAALIEQGEGATVPGAEAAGVPVAEPLTAREREIAMLAAARLSSREIADRLYLSVRTVNNHLQRVYTKLGVNSRAALSEALDAGRDGPAGTTDDPGGPFR